MKWRYPPLIVFLIAAYCAWNARSLISGWIDAPYEKQVWFIFFLWGMPLLYFWVANPPQSYAGNPWLIGIALSLSFVGHAGSINMLKYLGLACALAAFLPWRMELLVWLASSIAWMPAFGWLASHFYFADYLFFVRTIIILIGMIIGITTVKRICRHE